MVGPLPHAMRPESAADLPKRIRGQRNRLKKPLRLSLRRSFDRATPMCFSTALTLMLSRSAISRFFNPVTLLSRKTRRHCSESCDTPSSISCRSHERSNSSSQRSATRQRTYPSSVSSPQVPSPRRQVGQHRTREVDLRAPLPQHQKNVLHDILGEVAVVNQTESPDAQRLVMHQKELPEIGRMSVQFLHLLKSGRYGRPQSSESIFKYTKTRSHPEVFRENNAKRPKPNGTSFRTALLCRRLLAAGVPENKPLPVRCFFGIETKVRESLPHFVSNSQTPPFIYWNTANYPEQQK